MSVDTATVKRVANLSRIAISDERAETMKTELNTILEFAEQLNEVNVDGVEPMTSVINQAIYMRKDKITDGGYPDSIVKNAPVSDDNFFAVPKVIE